jgi:ribosomal protein S6
MSETTMPAAEVNHTTEQELVSYELAFHVLPTVAEGEVPTVFDALKAHITKHNGEITGEEAPKRFDLAYEITKYLEGKNRKFSSAYFGWVRFNLAPAELAALTEEVDTTKSLLRYLLIKLSKVEENNPFAFHDSIADKQAYTIDTDEEVESEVEVEVEVEVDAEVGVEAEVAEVAEAVVSEAVVEEEVEPKSKTESGEETK